jgi:hypothetical protein
VRKKSERKIPLPSTRLRAWARNDEKAAQTPQARKGGSFLATEISYIEVNFTPACSRAATVHGRKAVFNIRRLLGCNGGWLTTNVKIVSCGEKAIGVDDGEKAAQTPKLRIGGLSERSKLQPTIVRELQRA